MKICNKKMEYAHMELNGKMFLISAEEFSLYDKYLQYAHNKDREIKIIEPEEGNPLKIVYGMMLVNPIFDTTEAFKIADNVKNYSLFDISENNVNVSAYEDILFCMDYSKRCAGCEGYEFDCASTEKTAFPFAALMDTTHIFNGNKCAISIFPALSNFDTIFEKMINRPFVLACIKSFQIEGLKLTKDNWRKYIDKKDMLEAAERAVFVQ